LPTEAVHAKPTIWTDEGPCHLRNADGKACADQHGLLVLLKGFPQLALLAENFTKLVADLGHFLLPRAIPELDAEWHDLFVLAACRKKGGNVAGAIASLRECRGLSGIPERLSFDCAEMLAELGVE